MTLFEHYHAVRERTEHICSPLQTEDYVPQPVNFVSPPKWHLAHTTWFFEHFVLKDNLAGYELFDDDYAFLFNSYYNTVGNRVMRTDRGNITRPSVQKIYEYRAHVDVNMKLLFLSDIDETLRQTVMLGINHEQQHQELLLTDIKYILGNNPLFPVYHPEAWGEMEVNKRSGFAMVTAGVYEIGSDGSAFSFDNEHGRHKVYVDDFEVSNALVTNEEYLEFMNSGGYTDFNFWLDEGWSWVNDNKISAPLYWHEIDEEWHYYTLSGLKKVEPKAILTHISLYEALAFAEWKGMRLPTEFEWEIAADEFDWGKRWEWTNSAYLPYPRFKKPEGAIGEYNGKFMINQMVLRGGSCATAQNHSRKTYRNFFHPDERWQFNGIRLIKI